MSEPSSQTKSNMNSSSSFSVLAYGGLPDTYDTDAYLEAVNQAQSVYFFTLVFMQLGNLLSTRTRRLSLFQANPLGPNSPNRNLWIPPAMLASLAFLFLFSYVPFFQNIFLTRVSTDLSIPKTSRVIICTRAEGIARSPRHVRVEADNLRVSRSSILSCRWLSQSGSFSWMSAESTWFASTPRVYSPGSPGNVRFCAGLLDALHIDLILARHLTWNACVILDSLAGASPSASRSSVEDPALAFPTAPLPRSLLPPRSPKYIAAGLDLANHLRHTLESWRLRGHDRYRAISSDSERIANSS